MSYICFEKKKLQDWAGTKTFIRRSTEGNRHKCISLICDFVEDLGMEADGGTDDEKNGQSDQAYNCFLYLTELVYTFPEAIFIVFLLPLLFFV